MAELLKDVYSESFINSVADEFQKVYPSFQKELFVSTIFDTQWAQRELKSRLTFIAQTLHQFLPADFKSSCTILTDVAPHFSGYEAMFFPAFVELFGLDDYQTSIHALAILTQYSSAEFAVRPFILKYPQKMMAQMLVWAESENFHIRRLASEGCRPRLPWACALPNFKVDPSPILPILEQLKDDNEDYVYRSVANNLNDLSKDNPELVINIAQAWMANTPTKNRVWLVKHACRSLLKQGEPSVLKLFGFSAPEHIRVEQFEVQQKVHMGETLHFSFALNANKALGKCRVEFVIAFMKKNGKQADKIFKISESELNVTSKTMAKQFSFKAISTRKYYTGEHRLTILVNGVRLADKAFTLI